MNYKATLNPKHLSFLFEAGTKSWSPNISGAQVFEGYFLAEKVSVIINPYF